MLVLLLQEADVDLDGLDWIVCHSGADIWHAQQDGEWDADDQWEELIDFRYLATAAFQPLHLNVPGCSQLPCPAPLCTALPCTALT